MLKFIRSAIVVTALVVSTNLMFIKPAQAYIPAPPIGSLIDLRYYTNVNRTTEVGRWVYGSCDGQQWNEQWGTQTAYYGWRTVPCF
jgi:hypothetical protein